MQHECMLAFQPWLQPRANSLFVGSVSSYIKTRIRLWDAGIDFLKLFVQVCAQCLCELRMFQRYIGRFTQIIQDIV